MSGIELPSGEGDMKKSVYDTDNDSVVDNSEKLEGSTKAGVQNHTPKAHTLGSHSTKDHSELESVGANDHHTPPTVTQNNIPQAMSAIKFESAASKILNINQGSGKVNGTWYDLDVSAFVPLNAIAIFIHAGIIISSGNLQIAFRKKGETGSSRNFMFAVSGTLAMNHGSVLVGIDGDKKLQYAVTWVVYPMTWTIDARKVGYTEPLVAHTHPI
jgi:hypothetical protein